MSYQVLARKYRSRTFEELMGQEHVVQALANALTQQRLHHAYLFTGTRGVGKTSVSRILAKSLNCIGPDGQGGITAHPCGVCEACRDIDAGRFVDYVELDAASNRGVEEISQLLDQSVYKPVVGRFKVYMIDEVHMLSNTAFNAMLKTLEEPPEYLKFVLATTDPQKVPVTVLSRCLQFNLRPMSPTTVLEHLTRVLSTEQVPAEPGALRLLARAARGSMRDALSLTDQAIAFGSGELKEAGVRQMLGSVDRSHVVGILQALIAGDGAALVGASDRLRDMGLSASGTLEDLAAALQHLAVAQAAPGALDAGDPDLAELLPLADQLPADEVQLMYSIALHGRQELPLSPDEYAGLTMVLLRMMAFRPEGAVARAGGSGSGGAQVPTASTVRTEATSSVTGAPSAARAVAPQSAARSSASDASQASVASPRAEATERVPGGGSPLRSASPSSNAVEASPQAAPVAQAPAVPRVAQAAPPPPEPEPASQPEPDAASQSEPELSASPDGDATADHPPTPSAKEIVPADDAPEPLQSRASTPTSEQSSPETRPVAPPKPAASPGLRAQGAAPTRFSDRLRPRVSAAHAAAHAQALADEAAEAEDLSPPHDDDGPPPWLDAPPPSDEDVAITDGSIDDPAPTDAGGDIYVSTAVEEVTLTPTPVGERWAELVPMLRLTALTRELALQAECIAIDEQSSPQRWKLRVERESLRQSALQDKLQAALSAHLNVPVRLEIEAGRATDSPALRDTMAARARQRRAESIILEDPEVQQLLSQFKTARILPGSIKPL